MTTVIADIETEPIPPEGWSGVDNIWIFGGRDLETREVHRFEPFRGEEEKQRAIAWANTVDCWIGHNFVSFDALVVNNLLLEDLIPLDKVIDTMIVGKLVKYDRKVPKGCKSAHSLKAHGIRLGVHKGDFNSFEEYSEEMVTYWKGDLDTTEALYNEQKPYIFDPQWRRSMRVEHGTQIGLDEQQLNGFPFDLDRGHDILAEILEEKGRLEDEIQEDYPPTLEVTKSIMYKRNKDGNESANVQKARAECAAVKVDGDNLLCYNYVPFNPGSPVQRIDKLWEAGWKPFEKTKTHQNFGRLKVGDRYGKSVASMSQEFYDNKKEHLDYYGWTCSEDNLNTLPKSAPDAAKKLSQWLTLEGRRSSLVEWLGQAKRDGKVHGKVWHIGAWTQRCSHSNPNTANISRVWPEKKEPSTPVEVIKKKYDSRLRELWVSEDDEWLVGVDADGIQLRILGDQLWRHFDERGYADTIVAGNEDEGTDIHNVNRRALELEHVDRTMAKTFIYAWVLNAGLPKVASILRTTIPIANVSRDRFEVSIPGLKPFKTLYLPEVAKSKYFTGYDGRKVIVPSLHKTLAGILQAGETIVMKHARVRWVNELKGSCINVLPAGFIHDEWQTRVKGTYEEAEEVKRIQAESIAKVGIDLGFKIPLSGSGKIGKNWKETH